MTSAVASCEPCGTWTGSGHQDPAGRVEEVQRGALRGVLGGVVLLVEVPLQDQRVGSLRRSATGPDPGSSGTRCGRRRRARDPATARWPRSGRCGAGPPRRCARPKGRRVPPEDEHLAADATPRRPGWSGRPWPDRQRRGVAVIASRKPATMSAGSAPGSGRRRVVDGADPAPLVAGPGGDDGTVPGHLDARGQPDGGATGQEHRQSTYPQASRVTRPPRRRPRGPAAAGCDAAGGRRTEAR